MDGGMTKKTIGFIGLGVMGAPMARHLVGAGHDVRVYNRTGSKAEAFVAAHGGTIALTPVSAADGADVVISCVGNDDDLRAVTLGENGGAGGAFGGMAKGALFIDHSTVSASIARELSVEAERQGFAFVDAPVSGGQAGAENGKLSIMCGGTAAAFARAEAVMAAYALRIVHIGGAGAGQQAKMVNQICIAGVLQGLSEAVAFAQASGLNLGMVKDAIGGGAAQSWQMENRWDTMARGEFDFGFAIDWMRKDLGLVLAEADAMGRSLPMTAQVNEFYKDVQKMGGGRQDTSALIRRLKP
jgi:3-hydroxyisobutyrate dehydrogenase